MKRSKDSSKDKTNYSAINSAALQDHLLRKNNFNLDFKPLTSKKTYNLPPNISKTVSNAKEALSANKLPLISKGPTSILPY